VIDGGSRGAVGVATQVAGASCVDVAEAETLTHESVKLTRESAERAPGMRTVKNEWGVKVMALLINVHTGLYTVRCTRNGHVIHGSSSQQNTLHLTPSIPLGRHARNGHVRRQLVG